MIYTLLILGFFVGLLSTFFGIGGGVLIVPILFFLVPQATPAYIFANSLAVIFINGLINLRNFKKNQVSFDFTQGLVLGGGSILGIFLGLYCLQWISPKVSKNIFAFVLLIMVFKIYWKSNAKKDRKNPPYYLLKSALIGVSGGFTAGITGLGGGVIYVPLLLTILNFPFIQASAFSNYLMVLSTGGSVLLNSFKNASNPGVYQIGLIDWSIVLTISAMTLFSSPLGIFLSKKTSSHHKKGLFAIFFTTLCIIILWKNNIS